MVYNKGFSSYLFCMLNIEICTCGNKNKSDNCCNNTFANLTFGVLLCIF